MLRHLAGFVMVVVLLVGTEQVCYRFSYDYASWRNDFLGSSRQSNGWFYRNLSGIPFDAWAEPPNTNGSTEFNDATVEEIRYCARKMSGNRPFRDILYASLTESSLGEEGIRFSVEKFESLDLRVLIPSIENPREDYILVVGGKGSEPPSDQSLGREFDLFLRLGVPCAYVRVETFGELLRSLEFLTGPSWRRPARIFACAWRFEGFLLAEAVRRRPQFLHAAALLFPDPLPSPLAGTSPIEGTRHVLAIAGKNSPEAYRGILMNWIRSSRKGFTNGGDEALYWEHEQGWPESSMKAKIFAYGYLADHLLQQTNELAP
jgi:hypothetical protein